MDMGNAFHLRKNTKICLNDIELCIETEEQDGEEIKHLREISIVWEKKYNVYFSISYFIKRNRSVHMVDSSFVQMATLFLKADSKDKN